MCGGGGVLGAVGSLLTGGGDEPSVPGRELSFEEAGEYLEKYRAYFDLKQEIEKQNKKHGDILISLLQKTMNP